jgi:hypothetical protein
MFVNVLEKKFRLLSELSNTRHFKICRQVKLPLSTWDSSINLNDFNMKLSNFYISMAHLK